MTETITQILLVLLERPGTASEILDAIADLDQGREPSVATFYRQLARGCDAGWIEMTPAAEASSHRGRPGHRYSITPTGSQAVRAEAGRMRRLADAALAAKGAE